MGTAVFVDNAWQIAQKEQDLVVHKEIAQKEAYMSELKAIFNEADIDGSGSLTWEEFQHHLQDARIQAYLATLELDVTELRGVFEMLDLQGTEEVNIGDFVMGCMKLKGPAKSIDVCTILYENRKQACKWAMWASYSERQFQRLEDLLELPPMKPLDLQGWEATNTSNFASGRDSLALTRSTSHKSDSEALKTPLYAVSTPGSIPC